MSLGDLLFGKPLAAYEDSEQRLGRVAGIGVFGLDALSSRGLRPRSRAHPADCERTLLKPENARMDA